MRRQGNLDAFRSRTLWLAAAVLSATSAPPLQASEAGPTHGASTRLAQTATSALPERQAADGQDHPNAEMLARELAVTKHDLDVLLRLLNRACDASTYTGQAADREAAELRKALQEERGRTERLKRDLTSMRGSAQPQCAPATGTGGDVIPSKLVIDEVTTDLRKSLQQEHDRASRLEQDLGAARRDVEVQTALAAKAGAEANQLKKTADAGSADVRTSLQQEHDRASRLEQDLASARRDVETQTALASKAAAEANQLKKTAEAAAADVRKSLQQEHDRAGRLEQDLATARRDVETQTALAAKAQTDAGQLKKTADAGSADLRKSLQQEHDRASRLEQDLASARRDVGTQTALAAKTAVEASQFKKTADAGAADLRDLRKSLQEEHDRSGRLGHDLAAARRKFEKQIALAAKAAAEASQFKKTADAGAADLRKSVQEERDRASRLEQDLAAARREVEKQTAQASKVAAETNQSKPADAGSADLSLQQEHDRTSQLEQDLAASRRDVETQTALASKAAAEASQLKKTADAGSADLRKALQQEHDRASRLEQDLAAARRNVEAQTTLATKAQTEASQLKKTADAGSADLRKSLQQEHDRASRLEQDLAASRRDVETQTALATKAAAEASQLKKTTDAGSADLRKSLQQERDRANRLQEDLATARRDAQTQAALATRAQTEASQLKKTGDASSAELRKSLQQERDRAAQLAQDLALARSNAPAPSSTQQQVEAAEPVAAKPTAAPDTPPKTGNAAEIARLVTYARVLLARGDIGSARIVLQRAVDMGSAEASFTLAESYDPLILSKWGTFGTHGDASKALDLYARALAGGIKEAKERSEALHR